VGRPREHDQQTLEALLEAAERLVGESGSGALTVRSVADRAGTTTRAVYALFGSKDGLVQALAGRAFQLLSQRVESVPITADPAEDLVTAAVHGFRAFVLEHPDLFRLVFVVGVGMPFGAETAVAQSTAFGSLIQLVERVRAAGLLAHHRTEEVVLLWDVMCTGLATREVCGGQIDPSQGERIWSDALRVLLTGLGAEGARERKPRPAGL
jgi:AcrR family transcriptional regulator